MRQRARRPENVRRLQVSARNCRCLILGRGHTREHRLRATGLPSPPRNHPPYILVTRRPYGHGFRLSVMLVTRLIWAHCGDCHDGRGPREMGQAIAGLMERYIS